jgi:hypothetical protein
MGDGVDLQDEFRSGGVTVELHQKSLSTWAIGFAASAFALNSFGGE